MYMNGFMLGNIVKCFEWPLVRKGLHKCSSSLPKFNVLVNVYMFIGTPLLYIFILSMHMFIFATHAIFVPYAF